METRNLYFSDETSHKESHDIQHSGPQFRGVVEMTNELGEVLFKKSNLIVVPGRRFVLEKLFNIKSDVLFDNLREQMGIPSPVTENPELEKDMPLREKSVCLFGVGIGGAGLTFGQVYPPKFAQLKLNQPIPFRYVNTATDLTEAERKKYFLRHEENGNAAYYLKRFETKPELKIKRMETDLTPDEVGGNEDYDIYVELKLKVSAEDVREYFDSKGDLGLSRINELCLVFGYQPNEDGDYHGLETFSILSFNNEALDSTTKELNITYRIYA